MTTAAKAVSKVDQMGKIMAKAVKAVLPGITVLHQTFKTVAGTAVHLIKVVNVKSLTLISS